MFQRQGQGGHFNHDAERRNAMRVAGFVQRLSAGFQVRPGLVKFRGIGKHRQHNAQVAFGGGTQKRAQLGAENLGLAQAEP